MMTLTSQCATKHGRPSCKDPWWDWACATCDPDLFHVITSKEHLLMATPSVECPMCLNPATYRGGSMNEHRDDGGLCRFSGLSLPVAEWMIRAIVKELHPRDILDTRIGYRQKQVHEMNESSRKLHETVYKPIATYCGVLRSARLSSGKGQIEISELCGVQPGSLGGWERLLTTPPMNKLILWAKSLHYGIAVVYPSHENEIIDLFGLKADLINLRNANDWSRDDVARRAAVPVHLVSKWESPNGRPSVQDFLKWLAAFDGRIELRLQIAGMR